MSLTTLLPPLPAAPPETPATKLKGELIGLLREYSANQPRSLQQAIGPSEVGHPCDRRIALQVFGSPQCNRHAGDPLPSLVGTSAHSMMEEVLRRYNAEHGPRFLIEQRVYPAHGFGGTMDAYDAATNTVIDWKFPGQTKMTKVRRDEHPGVVYETQAHLYGLGAARMGLPVKHVAIAFLPRAGFTTGMHIWHAAYDEQVAQAALDRMWSLIALGADLAVDEHPERFGLFPTTPFMCEYCPFFRPNPTGPHECRGGTR